MTDPIEMLDWLESVRIHEIELKVPRFILTLKDCDASGRICRTSVDCSSTYNHKKNRSRLNLKGRMNGDFGPFV